MKTPLAVFAYRRPEHLERCLAALARCARIEECAVTIFCDGPRTDSELDEVEAARKVARGWADLHEAAVRESSENRGLARSIGGGVTELCAAAGRVIVLEDDLEPAPDFLRYMLAALDRYAECPQVMQISGYMHAVELSGECDAVLLPVTTTWGWATWQRAWQHFTWEPPGTREALADPATRRRFNLDDSYDYAGMLEARLRGANDSWGVLWLWTVFARGGLTLHPRGSLIANHGFDGTGTHCRGESSFPPSRRWALPADLRWPAALVPDAAALARVQDFLRQHRTSASRWAPSTMLSTLLQKARNALAPDPASAVLRPDDCTPDTAVYWDPAMAAALETWGEGNAWDEIQLLLAGASGRGLDIACGTGKTMDLLKRFPALELHGCDFSDFLLQKATARGLAPERLTQCDATKMPYPDRAFAFSYSIGSLEHFTEEGIAACAAEAARITTGFSAHMVPVARSGRDDGWIKTVQSYYNMSAEWWLAKFQAAFPVVHVLDSRWRDAISVGKWFICRRS